MLTFEALANDVRNTDVKVKGRLQLTYRHPVLVFMIYALLA